MFRVHFSAKPPPGSENYKLLETSVNVAELSLGMVGTPYTDPSPISLTPLVRGYSVGSVSS